MMSYKQSRSYYSNMPKEKNFKKQLNLKTIASALAIAALLFGTGVFTGFSINKERLSAVEVDLTDTAKGIENFQLQFLFLNTLGEESACPLLQDSLKTINKQAYEIGRKLTENNPDNGEITDYNYFQDLTERYSRVLTSYWLLSTKMKDTCHSKEKTVIFFIEKDSCNKQNPNMCDAQGFVLDNVKRTYGDSLLVFTLHTDVKEPSVKALKDYYKVEKYPTLIIDGTKYDGFVDKQSLVKSLCDVGLCP